MGREKTWGNSEGSFLAVPQGGNQPHYSAGRLEVLSSVHKKEDRKKQTGCYSAVC